MEAQRCGWLLALLGAGCSGVLPAPLSKPQGRYVAVASDGHVFHSGDGRDWASTGRVTTANLHSVAFGDGVFVAVGAGGTVVTSENGEDWSTVDAATTTDLEHVIFEDGVFVAVGGSWETGAVSIKSDNGRTWHHLDAPDSHMFHAVGRHAGHMVAAAAYRSDLQTPALFSSAVDRGSLGGAGWMPSTGPDFQDAVVAFGALFVVGGEDVARLAVGGTFQTQPLPDAQGLRTLTFGPGGAVALGEGHTAFHSVDGETWTAHRVPGVTGAWMSGATHGEAGYVAVGSVGSVLFSVDGREWTLGQAPTRLNLRDVAFGMVRVSH